MNLGWNYLRLALYVCLSIVFLVVFDALLNPVETDEVSPAYWNTSAYDAFNEITAMRLSKSESEAERFLVLDDDDRHDNGPNEQDATNGPTVLGYTKIPSSRPSVQPSPSPTSMPTSFPTSSPSGKPSGIPSSLPTSMPSVIPSVKPSVSPNSEPSLKPTKEPSMVPSIIPSKVPSSIPTDEPSSSPSSLLSQTDEVTTIRNRSMWMIAAGGIVALTAIVVGTRYRYVSQFKSDGSGELKDNYESELFVEYNSSVESSLR